MMKRSIFLVLALLTVSGVVIWRWYADGLSTPERQFLGTWYVRPSSPGTKLQKITFSSDKKVFVDGQSSIETTWSVSGGQLQIHHHYKVSLMRNMPLPGFRKTETFGWSAIFSENGNRITLTHVTPVANPLANRILLREAKTDGP